jgi:hypothetical protein
MLGLYLAAPEVQVLHLQAGGLKQVLPRRTYLAYLVYRGDGLHLPVRFNQRLSLCWRLQHMLDPPCTLQIKAGGVAHTECFANDLLLLDYDGDDEVGFCACGDACQPCRIPI